MTERLENAGGPPRFDPARMPTAAAETPVRRAHIIVVGNEKGGTGKSTAAMHLVVGLLREGKSVASIDLDFHQASLTRYIENRKKFAVSAKADLQVPDHHHFNIAAAAEGTEPPDRLEQRFAELVDRLAETSDVIVIDCPGSDTVASRYALSRADTLLTPMNDSFVDLDLLAKFEGTPAKIVRIGHFSEMVWQQKKRRSRRDGGRLDWVVLRNRYNPAASRNRQAVGDALDLLSRRLGFRIADGFGERVIFRELFLLGLTMLDFRADEPLIAHSPSHLAALRESRNLIATVAVPKRTPPNAISRPASQAAARKDSAPAPQTNSAPAPRTDAQPAARPESDPAPAAEDQTAKDQTAEDQTAKDQTAARLITMPEPTAGDGAGEAAVREGAARQVLVIYNPVAGLRNRRRFRATLRHLAVSGCVVAVLETTAKGEAESLARAALDENFDVIVAAGGDGTINEVANALAGSGTVMGVLPLGTLNVLAAEIGLPADPRKIAQVIVAGRPRKIHLGRAGERRFSIAAAVGFDAQVAARIRPFAKRYFGRLAYVMRSAFELIRYRPSRYSVEIDGKSFLAASVVIANGHYYAGRLAYAPEARLDDPRLHVCLFARPGRWNVVRYRLALLMGRLPKLPDVQVLPAYTVEITGSAGEPVHADGEIVTQLPARFDVAREELSILAPG